MTGRNLDADSESRTEVVTKLILIKWPSHDREGGKRAL